MNAYTNSFCLIAKFHVHTLVENIEAALPQAIIGKLFAILNDSTIYLVDLFKAAVFMSALNASQRIPPVQYVTIGLSLMASYFGSSISLIKSWLVRTSGTMAF